MDLTATDLPEDATTGLDFWMDRVIAECDRARLEFAPESVHDLRVALRRCRSIADVFIAFDPHPEWRQMKDEGKRLFGQLGALRDTQVMLEWIRRIAAAETDLPVPLNNYLSNQEAQLKETASEALNDFNQKKWAGWARRLSRRARQIPLEPMAIQHLALERWEDAYELHRQALRNRTYASYHRLRIGLKKFRYVLENFLPSLHESWGGDLRQLQDLLGEMHDLHVLWQTALAVKSFRTEASRAKWRQRIMDESRLRIESYRRRMLGQESLWQVWRPYLPQAGQIRIAALSRLRVWASFRDPDFAHSEHVAALARQIYDGMDSLGLLRDLRLADARLRLEAAALCHDVGKAKAQKKHHIFSYRMICRFGASPGWDIKNLRCIALIARYHRGALPRPDQKAFSHIPSDQRKDIILLSGILRLANAFDSTHRRKVRRLVLSQTAETVCIQASGYSETDSSAERLAAARHLLETSCRRPILIRSL